MCLEELRGFRHNHETLEIGETIEMRSASKLDARCSMLGAPLGPLCCIVTWNGRQQSAMCPIRAGRLGVEACYVQLLTPFADD